MRVTDAQRLSTTCAVATTRPAGVSSRTVVVGSTAGTRPVSIAAVTTPMVPWPHIGRHPVTSM